MIYFFVYNQILKRRNKFIAAPFKNNDSLKTDFRNNTIVGEGFDALVSLVFHSNYTQSCMRIIALAIKWFFLLLLLLFLEWEKILYSKLNYFEKVVIISLGCKWSIVENRQYDYEEKKIKPNINARISTYSQYFYKHDLLEGNKRQLVWKTISSQAPCVWILIRFED